SRTRPATAYAIACGAWTPALPNAMPARVAAHIIWWRASWSAASRTARARNAPHRRSASRQPMSLHGLRPWLIGRVVAGAGAGRRENARAVNDSIAWQSTSMPLAATTLAGRVWVTRGSTIASLGRNFGDAMPVLAWWASQSKIAIPVTSLPVPDVVGHAMCG